MRYRTTLAVLPIWIFVAGASSLAADGASFQGLGRLRSGDDSFASGVSDSGSVVVGLSGVGPRTDAFRWTAAAGMQRLGPPAGGTGSAGAAAVSADGSTVVTGYYSPDSPNHQPTPAFRWTEGGGFAPLGAISGRPGDGSAPSALSADGSVIVGQSTNAAGETEAFRWTAPGGMSGLGFLDPVQRFSWAMDVSRDGSVVVGSSNSGNNARHFRWTSATGLVPLSEIPGTQYSRAVAVSDDGTTVVGVAITEQGQPGAAYRWTEAAGMKLLRTPPPEAKEIANDVSADGRVVVGNAEFGAFIWDPLNGMRPLEDVLIEDYGLGEALVGWRLGAAFAISGDGGAIVGVGTNPGGEPEAFLAILPEPSSTILLLPCAALLLRHRRRRPRAL